MIVWRWYPNVASSLNLPFGPRISTPLDLVRYNPFVLRLPL